MEAMAIEQLVLRAWELEGYWGRTRQRVQPRNGGNWPEIDVVAVRSRKDGRVDVRFAETKVQQGANFVYVMDDNVRTIGAREWLGTWANFCTAVAEVYWYDVPKLPGLPRWDRIASVEVVLVFNGWEPPGAGAREALERELKGALKSAWNYTRTPGWMDIVDGKVTTTYEVAMQVIRCTREHISNGRGARFGDPFLDATREILRYLNAQPSWVPCVSKLGSKLPSSGTETREQIRAEALRALFAAFGITAADVAAALR
jgi:hypothetical protein